jgi:hypothetical protein
MRIVDEHGNDLRKVELWLTPEEVQEVLEALREFEPPPYPVYRFGPTAGWGTRIDAVNGRTLELEVPTDREEALEG